MLEYFSMINILRKMLSIFFLSLRKWKDKMFSHDDYVFHWREKIIRKWGVPIWPVSFRFSFWFFFHKRCNLYGLLYSEIHAHKYKCMYNIQSSCNTLVRVPGNVHLLARPWLQFLVYLYTLNMTPCELFFSIKLESQ